MFGVTASTVTVGSLWPLVHLQSSAPFSGASRFGSTMSFWTSVMSEVDDISEHCQPSLRNNC